MLQYILHCSVYIHILHILYCMDQKQKLKVFPGTVLYCIYILHIQYCMDQKQKLKVFPGTVLYCIYILHILHGSETEAEGVSGYSTVLYVYFTYTAWIRNRSWKCFRVQYCTVYIFYIYLMDQKLKLKVFPGTVCTVYISFLEANYLILLHFFQPVYRFYIYPSSRKKSVSAYSLTSEDTKIELSKIKKM